METPTERKSMKRGFIIGCGMLCVLCSIPLWPFLSCAGHLATDHAIYSNYYRLLDAIDHNNVSEVRQILDGGYNPNKYPEGWEGENSLPLNDAVYGQNIEIVSLLLDHGADPNGGDAWGTPFSTAIDNGSGMPLIKLLVERGMTIFDDKQKNSEALWEAVQAGRVDVATYLVGLGANPDSYSVGWKESLLHYLNGREDTLSHPIKHKMLDLLTKAKVARAKTQNGPKGRVGK